MRNCKYCGELFIPQKPTEKYCGNTCRRLNTNEIHRENRKRDYSNEALVRNFNEVVTAPYHLTTKGFESVSKIGVRSYARLLKQKNWIAVVEMFGELSTLHLYIVKEYKKYIEFTSKQNLQVFCRNHPYITYRFLQSIGLDKIRRAAGAKKLRYSDYDLKENFLKVMKRLEAVPTYTEFIERSEIAISTYAYRFELTDGEVYTKVLEQYCSEEKIDMYNKRRAEYKKKVGQQTGKMSAKYSESDYEEEFNRVFEYWLSEFGETPTRRGFNMLSKFDDRTYRKKFKMAWTEVCEMYGYKIEVSNKTEKQLLNMISDILGASYETQKQFPWLVGVSGMPLRCDGYFHEFKLVVEYDGIQHFEPVEFYGGISSFNKTQENDAIKNKEIPNNGLKLLRIPYFFPWLNRDYLSKEIKDALFKDKPILYET
ncbi:hypothetical protein [Halobacillus sp. Cin3]|uniref:hypothetical protein n=1 Tax=Halobacillus sp. Cin3 TaxID=2928441 RepID=UPI00248F0BA4|nr:hypothetical protein [Halobacillus sp. Cin3]